MTTAGLLHLLHLAEALLLELGISHGQDFVDDQNFGFEMGRNGEREADVHAGGIAFHGRVEEAFDSSEGDDGVEVAGDLAATHAEDAAVEEDVFAAGEFGMEAGADFEQATDATAKFDAARSGFDDAREYLEQGTFAGSVLADDADRFAGLHFETDVFQGPEFAAGGGDSRIGRSAA